ncbi:MAG: hypothetical protein AAFQ07_02135, partial [Chloroflexota bacterium]
EAEETVTVDVQLDGDSIFITDETADENGVAELALVSDDTDTLGEYDVIVTRDNDEIATGVFTLASDITNAITDDNDDDDEQDDEQQDDDTVDLGSIDLNAELEYELTGELTDDEPFVEYLFVGTEGQEVTITLDSEDFDTYLFLVDEDGNELISTMIVVVRSTHKLLISSCRTQANTAFSFRASHLLSQSKQKQVTLT